MGAELDDHLKASHVLSPKKSRRAASAGRPAKGEEIGFAVRMGRRGYRALRCCGGASASDVSRAAPRGRSAHLPLRGPSSFRGIWGRYKKGDCRPAHCAFCLPSMCKLASVSVRLMRGNRLACAPSGEGAKTAMQRQIPYASSFLGLCGALPFQLQLASKGAHHE